MAFNIDIHVKSRHTEKDHISNVEMTLPQSSSNVTPMCNNYDVDDDESKTVQLIVKNTDEPNHNQNTGYWDKSNAPAANDDFQRRLPEMGPVEIDVSLTDDSIFNTGRKTKTVELTTLSYTYDYNYEWDGRTLGLQGMKIWSTKTQQAMAFMGYYGMAADSVYLMKHGSSTVAKYIAFNVVTESGSRYLSYHDAKARSVVCANGESVARESQCQTHRRFLGSEIDFKGMRAGNEYADVAYGFSRQN